jgi:uncharacterized membrane protein
MPGGLGAWAVVVLAVVVVLAMAFVYLLSRDKDVARTSFGFHVSRERYEELDEQVTQEHPLPPPAVTESWPAPRKE